MNGKTDQQTGVWKTKTSSNPLTIAQCALSQWIIESPSSSNQQEFSLLNFRYQDIHLKIRSIFGIKNCFQPSRITVSINKFTLFQQWLPALVRPCTIYEIEDSWYLPQDLLRNCSCKAKIGHLHLCFKNVCKCDWYIRVQHQRKHMGSFCLRWKWMTIATWKHGESVLRNKME
jgi:hypothetical protein